MRRFFGRCLLILMGAAVPLLGLELALRAMYPQPRVLDRHGRLGAVPRPHLDIRKTYGGHERVVRITTNSVGLREREIASVKPAGVKRLLALGDSFTFGDAVEWVEAWPQQLEQILNAEGGWRRYEVINAGISGYGTARQLLLYQTLEARVQPDVVGLGFSVVNDVLDNLCVEEPYYRPRVDASCFSLAGDRLVPREPGPVNGKRPPIEFLVAESRAAEFLVGQARRASVSNPVLLGILRRAGVDLPLPNVPATVASWSDPRFSEPGWVLTRRILVELRNSVAARGIPLVILIIPASVQVDPGRHDTLALLGRNHPAVQAYIRDPLKPQRALLGLCDELQVACVDPLSALRVAEARGEHPYYRIDGHWTPAGHRIAAAIVARRLRELGFGRSPLGSRVTPGAPVTSAPGSVADRS